MRRRSDIRIPSVDLTHPNSCQIDMIDHICSCITSIPSRSHQIVITAPAHHVLGAREEVMRTAFVQKK